MSKNISDVQVSAELGVGTEVLILLAPDNPKEDPIPIRTQVRTVSIYRASVDEARSRNGLAVIEVSQSDRGRADFEYKFTDFSGQEQGYQVIALFRFTPDRTQLNEPHFINPSDVRQLGYAWRGERPPW